MTSALVSALIPEIPRSAQASLFEPSETGPIKSAVSYVDVLLFGNIAVGLCVLAVAFVGALMLTGRLPVRRGFEVVTGCFVLLGASVIANGFMTV